MVLKFRYLASNGMDSLGDLGDAIDVDHKYDQPYLRPVLQKILS